MMDQFLRTADGGIRQINIGGRPFPDPFPETLLPDGGHTVDTLTPQGSNTRMSLKQRCSWRNQRFVVIGLRSGVQGME